MKAFAMLNALYAGLKSWGGRRKKGFKAGLDAQTPVVKETPNLRGFKKKYPSKHTHAMFVKKKARRKIARASKQYNQRAAA